jgi:transcriptional regulator with XRE-family HTH domain
MYNNIIINLKRKELLMTFDLEEYIKRLEDIRAEKLWSRLELARSLGLDYQTLLRLYKHKKMPRPVTMRRIRDFVRNYDNGQDIHG